MFSKACEYGIRAVIYIWSKSADGVKLGVKDICKEIDTPEFFTAKILQSLAKQNLISSTKGPNGGFYISKEQENMKLLAVVEAIDGDKLFRGCGLGLKHCNENHPCPIHDDYKIIRENLVKLLSEKTIRELAKEVNEGKATLTTIGV
ncbi:RrF2 family transcriptional regulator [Cyclobacterium marinum]|uniref:Transcriptional regulator, BadM/Rrf2 family n=1 Tax=Cyclobacterium marinum (strain ATCC 25205 / DSM 745 / LMG 13164 / NCIMB 1802) TaxID=880070 RepID=G0J1X0_CYCMS|nr:Rrf2 family transcriptional regulator [Cyclobacterium marinum]AEL23976.1 transcriptional regulator, BadM/Rrf2 family [Cyclobacterium marinum DSM 745]MBI0398760.1 Rrf2 family transcriptional regulator [Cyclobacterium marinum]